MTKKRYIYEFTSDGETEAVVGRVEVPSDADESRISIELGDVIADRMKLDVDEMRVYDIDQDVLPDEYAFNEWENLEVYEGIVEYGEVVDVNHLW